MKNIFLVDVDDTILDFHGASALALRFAFEENGIAWEEGLGSAFRSFNAGLWEALERKEITRAELIRERFPRFFKRMGMEEVDGYAVNRSFIDYISTHPIYVDGAENFLKELSKMGRVYLVTNGTTEIQKSRFDIANLWEKAEKVFISHQVGFDKPAKEYTDHVIKNIPNFARDNAVWIGDSLSADIKAANDAEITSIWFNPKKKSLSGEVKPSYIAESFEDVLEILQKINANL